MARYILVIDDNVMNMKLMHALLELSGHEFSSAVNGQEAREAVARRRPDLILMDIQLPDTDGYALTREFRQRPELKDVPILAVTASAMRGDEQRALDAGCNGYISKPIDTRAFIGTVARFLASGPASQAG